MRYRLVIPFLILLLCAAIQANARGIVACAGGGAPACTTEAEAQKGSTAGYLNPIGSASYNDYAAQIFTASANATICKASLRMYRTETDSSPALTGKVCIYDATGYVSNTAWASGTAYYNYANRIPTSANGYVYRQTVASCTSGGSEPDWSTTVGSTHADNDCSWTNVGINKAPGSVVGTCSDELNMINASTTSEGDVTFSNISASVVSGTDYFIVFHTPTVGDSGDYVWWAYVSGISSPSTYLIGGTVSSMGLNSDGRMLKFILYK